jgi:hypothetical protein
MSVRRKGRLKMNCVHLIPRAGLANRLRALVSAQWLSARLQKELYVTWEPDVFLPGSWEDLFEERLSSPPRGIKERDTLQLEEPTFIDPNDPTIQAADVLELRTCQAFSFRPEIKALSYRFWAEVRSHLLRLTPVEEVRSLVDRVFPHFGPHVLGVHIRIGGSRLEFLTPHRATPGAFFAEIESILAETPTTRIYLASDSFKTVSDARERFGDAVITMDAFVERDFRTTDSIEDIQVALAELVLLSRTNRILGTFFSSFGLLAGAMGALPYKELCMPHQESCWRQIEPRPPTRSKESWPRAMLNKWKKSFGLPKNSALNRQRR